MDYFHGAISVQTAKRILLTSSKGQKIGRYLLREVEDSHIISYVDAKEKVDHILLITFLTTSNSSSVLASEYDSFLIRE